VFLSKLIVTMLQMMSYGYNFICFHWFVVIYRTMSVQLQQNPSTLERGSELTSQRNSGNIGHNLHTSAYEKALLDLAHDKKLERDLAVGRQVGFYRIRGELGSGNFSQVKLGVHILTRGKDCDYY